VVGHKAAFREWTSHCARARLGGLLGRMARDQIIMWRCGENSRDGLSVVILRPPGDDVIVVRWVRCAT
jgi:hypothetical protein